MSYSLVVDLVLVVLLMVTIGYCFAVNRKLQPLRDAQDEMGKLIAGFGEATARAEASIAELKAAAEDAASNLGPKIDAARELISDLDMLNHRAGKLARRLEAGGPAPARGTGASAPQAPRALAPARDGTARSRGERELIKALKAAQ